MYVKMEVQVVKYKLLVLENYIVSLHMHKKNLNKYCRHRYVILARIKQISRCNELVIVNFSKILFF
jgi:hypothetical protein